MHINIIKINIKIDRNIQMINQICYYNLNIVLF